GRSGECGDPHRSPLRDGGLRHAGHRRAWPGGDRQKARGGGERRQETRRGGAARQGPRRGRGRRRQALRLHRRPERHGSESNGANRSAGADADLRRSYGFRTEPPAGRGRRVRRGTVRRRHHDRRRLPRAFRDPAAGVERPAMKSILPITTVVLAVLAIWYAFAVWMNAPLQRDAYTNAGRADYSTQDLIVASLNMERPKLPGPHQVAAEMIKLIVATPPTSKRSLVYHTLITLEETLIGFVIGAALGIGLAV